MKSRQPLKLDLNNLFKPFVADGLENLAVCEEGFATAHQGIKVLKQTGNLQFSNLPQDDILKDNILLMAKQFQGYDNVVVLGIGGSALGTSSIYQALYGPYASLIKSKERSRLFVVDHIEAQTIKDLFDLIANDNNLFVVTSKSGNTSETLAQYLLVKKTFPHLNKKNFLFITDPQSGFLHDLVAKEDHAHLVIPSGVGGRFSVFSSVGLFPLAVCGVGIVDLLDGARHAEDLCRNDQFAQNPAGLIAGTLFQLLHRQGLSQVVMMPYSERLRLFSDWFAQLWGESLAKMHTLDGQKKYIGSTPIKSVGVTDQHSQLQLYLEGPKNKVVFFVEVEHTDYEGHLGEVHLDDGRIDFLSEKTLHALMMAERAATEESLRENDRPNATIKLPVINEFQLGQLYQIFMNVIPYMGAFCNINAFDQPGVERIKKFTFGLMGRRGFESFAEKMQDLQKNREFIF